MPLPFSITGRVAVDGVFDAVEATGRLERALEELRAKRIKRERNQIRFVSGLFRLVSSHNLLLSIGAGELSIEPSEAGIRVTYRLEFIQIFFVVSAMVFGFLGPSLLSAPNLSLGEASGVLGFAWLWLYGANVLSTMWRFPRWVQRTLIADRKHSISK